MANDILKRLKSILGFNTDIELSSFLGVTPQSISQWKKRNSLDYDLLIQKLPLDIDLNFIFRGSKAIYEKIFENEYDNAVKTNRNLLEINEDLGERILELNNEIIKLNAQIQILQDTLIKVQSSNSYQMSKVSNQEFHKNIAAEKLKGYK